MATAAQIPFGESPGTKLEALLSFVGGVAMTLAVFLAIAHFTGEGEPEPVLEIEDLRAMSVPAEPPPPKIVPRPEVVETVVPFAGLELSSSSNPAKISVLPPDLAVLMPTTQVPPAAAIQTTQLFSDLKPKIEMTADFQHVYQPSEVDQRTSVLSRPNPRWPRTVGRGVRTLRVTFLMIVNVNGTAEGVRLLKSSGNPEFDAQVTQQIKEEWVFAPALKNNRKVRCLVQQVVSVSLSSSSMFEL